MQLDVPMKSSSAKFRLQSAMSPLVWAVVLFAFVGWPFFWAFSPYSNVFSVLFAIIIVWLFFRSTNRVRINAFAIALSAFLILLLLSTGFSARDEIQSKFLFRAFWYLVIVGAVLAISSIKFQKLEKITNITILLYLCISLPSLLIFLSFLLRWPLPYLNIDLGGRGEFYRLYPFGIISESAIFAYFGDPWLVRINGFSEEPGVLGTFVVFFLILNRMVGPQKSKKKREVCLHILGILSLSVYYYLSVFIFFLGWFSRFLFELKQKRPARFTKVNSLRVGLIIVGLGISLIVIRPGNPIYYWTVAKFSLDDSSTLLRSGRSQYDERIGQYLQSANLKQIFFGNGPGSNSLDADAGYASWAGELYDEGILSIVVVVAMFLYIAFRLSISERGRFRPGPFFVILPAILSYYQRPDILSPMMLIFWVVVARKASTSSAIVSETAPGSAPPISGPAKVQSAAAPTPPIPI